MTHQALETINIDRELIAALLCDLEKARASSHRYHAWPEPSEAGHAPSVEWLMEADSFAQEVIVAVGEQAGAVSRRGADTTVVVGNILGASTSYDRNWFLSEVARLSTNPCDGLDADLEQMARGLLDSGVIPAGQLGDAERLAWAQELASCR